MLDPYADDSHRWLEDLDGPDAVRWVEERNTETLSAPAGDDFRQTRDEIREILDSKDRIPVPSRRGDGFYYDFWRDADHPRGLWRRTTPEEFRRDEPDWDVLLDLDALNAAEGENWTWSYVSVLRPGYDRCLISLSRGGADAVVVREFDLRTRSFVADGFTLPEAKSDVSWIDADHLYVATDFGPGSMTSSGYPRVVKCWRRGPRWPTPHSSTRGSRTTSRSGSATIRTSGTNGTSSAATSTSTAASSSFGGPPASWCGSTSRRTPTASCTGSGC
ncbi:prolyl oligopeptidase family protein [Paractinoplanes durhamensis]|uniref:hypothetical protein n=1 Tax=Paractinoplanes durhamensis TaxID=113563 RepID=UPI003636EE1B